MFQVSKVSKLTGQVEERLAFDTKREAEDYLKKEEGAYWTGGNNWESDNYMFIGERW